MDTTELEIARIIHELVDGLAYIDEDAKIHLWPNKTKEAIQKINKLIIEARLSELKRTISFFDDENRESKVVLKAFVKNRTDELTNQIKEHTSE